MKYFDISSNLSPQRVSHTYTWLTRVPLKVPGWRRLQKWQTHRARREPGGHLVQRFITKDPWRESRGSVNLDGNIITFLFSLTSNWNLLFLPTSNVGNKPQGHYLYPWFGHSRNQRGLYITLICCRLSQDTIYALHVFEIIGVIGSNTRYYLMS